MNHFNRLQTCFNNSFWLCSKWHFVNSPKVCSKFQENVFDSLEMRMRRNFRLNSLAFSKARTFACQRIFQSINFSRYGYRMNEIYVQRMLQSGFWNRIIDKNSNLKPSKTGKGEFFTLILNIFLTIERFQRKSHKILFKQIEMTINFHFIHVYY